MLIIGIVSCVSVCFYVRMYILCKYYVCMCHSPFILSCQDAQKYWSILFAVISKVRRPNTIQHAACQPTASRRSPDVLLSYSWTSKELRCIVICSLHSIDGVYDGWKYLHTYIYTRIQTLKLKRKRKCYWYFYATTHTYICNTNIKISLLLTYFRWFILIAAHYNNGIFRVDCGQ